MPSTSTPLPQLIYPRVFRLRERLEAQIYSMDQALTVQIGPVHDQHYPLAQAQKESFQEIKAGDVFGPAKQGPHGEFPWTHRWFKVELPAAKEGETGRRHLNWMAHGEFTVYIDGTPWSGIDCCHPRSPLPDNACTLWIDAGQWQTGIWGGWPAPDEHGFRFFHCNLELRNESVWKVFHDLDMLIQWVERRYKEEGLPKNTINGYYEPIEEVSPQLRRMLKRLNDACDVFDSEGLGSLENILQEIYSEYPAEASAMQVSYVAHAHIDLVWLWPERASYRKAIHTYATTLRLMEKYPEISFTMSQPPLFYALQALEPQQAKEIQQRIDEGRWEFTGGLEVEADTQIPAGEGLVRSLIYGQERIEAIRGQKSDTVWIPDVFGYSQCLPQIFSLGGIKNFYTTKILWSTITKFPHNSFVWKGPDGSEVLTHLAVAGYNCWVNLEEASNAQREYRQSDVHQELLCATGYGDGGGGLTEEHCERGRRLKSLAQAPTSGWSTVESFFKRLDQVREELPRYRGELYLEYHRGVQTTQSDFKAALRACERSLQTREALLVIAKEKALAPEEWLRVLFAHFHDAIPGSSINSVYEELTPELQKISHEQKGKAEKEWPEGDQWVCANPLAWKRFVCVDVPEGTNSVQLGQGDTYPVQRCHSTWKVNLPIQGLEAMLISFSDQVVVQNEIQATETLLDNGIVTARFNEQGQLDAMSIHGEPLLFSSAGQFTLHHDQPADFDAWDIDHHSQWMKEALTAPLNLKVIAQGPAIAILEGRCSLGEQSTMVLRYILEAHSESLKLECDIDWKENHRLLRYEIQTDYRGQSARFGCPFGSIDRNQTEARQQEEAQWEVPASRWASILDGQGEGLCIVSEAKYGFNAKDGLLGLSLLRSCTYPDPVADLGHHTIRFAITKHRHQTDDQGLATAAKADDLYTEAVMLSHAKSVEAPIVFSKLGSVVPSWVMPSRHHGGFLVRLHETAGAMSAISFTVSSTVKSQLC